MKLVAAAILPLAVLMVLIQSAGLLSYGFLKILGDVQAIDKIISRATQILLVLCIFPFKKRLQFGWRDLGFAPLGEFFKQLGKGLVLSLCTLLPVLLTLYLLDVHVFDDSRDWTAGKIAGKIGISLLLALLIAGFEETIFRGLLLTFLRQKMPILAAVFISSFYYAILHFLKSSTSVPYAELRITSCFQLMGEAFANLLNPAIVGALIALFTVGVFLAVLRTYVPQGLGYCIGCHCGWVWQIKISKDFFNLNPRADYQFLVSGYDGVIGPLVSIWLTLAILAFGFFSWRRGTSFLKIV